MTNRERINKMSDEELAKVLGCLCCIYFNAHSSGPNCSAKFEVSCEPWCHKGVKEWLDSEVENEEQTN